MEKASSNPYITSQATLTKLEDLEHRKNIFRRYYTDPPPPNRSRADVATAIKHLGNRKAGRIDIIPQEVDGQHLNILSLSSLKQDIE